MYVGFTNITIPWAGFKHSEIKENVPDYLQRIEK